jgi:hypothetical protein
VALLGGISLQRLGSIVRFHPLVTIGGKSDGRASREGAPIELEDFARGGGFAQIDHQASQRCCPASENT